MKALIKRIILQMKNDKRSLALMMVAPLLILTLLWLLLGDSAYDPLIGVDSVPLKITNAFEEAGAKIVELNRQNEDDFLKGKKAAAVVRIDLEGIHIKILDYTDSMKAGAVSKVIKDALAKLNPSTRMEVTYVYGKADASMFDSMGYLLLAILSFFIIFMIAGISFIRERTSQTMERLMLTPIKRWQVVMGYTLGFGLFSTVQSILIVLYIRYVLGMSFAGSTLWAIVTMVLLAFTAVAIGAFVSIFSNTEFQIVQFVPIIVIPQIFFSGLLPLDTIPLGLGRLAVIMPVYYASSALKAVVIHGEGFNAIWGNLAALGLFLFVFSILNMLALKRYRRL